MHKNYDGGVGAEIFGNDARNQLVSALKDSAFSIFPMLPRLNHEVLKDPEVKQAAQKGLENALRYSPDRARLILRLGILDPADLKTPEIKNGAQEGLLFAIVYNHDDEVKYFLGLGILDPADLKTPEIKNMAQKMFKNRLEGGEYNFDFDFNKVIKAFVDLGILELSDVATPEIQKVALDGLEDNIRDQDDFERYKKIIESLTDLGILKWSAINKLNKTIPAKSNEI